MRRNIVFHLQDRQKLGFLNTLKPPETCMRYNRKKLVTTGLKLERFQSYRLSNHSWSGKALSSSQMVRLKLQKSGIPTIPLLSEQRSSSADHP